MTFGLVLISGRMHDKIGSCFKIYFFLQYFAFSADISGWIVINLRKCYIISYLKKSVKHRRTQITFKGVFNKN